jgi:hypothetical protein
MDVGDFVVRQVALLALEREEEQLQRQEKYDEINVRTCQRLQARGELLMGLSAESPSHVGGASSLEGHSLLCLSRTGKTYLPSHRFTSGMASQSFSVMS